MNTANFRPSLAEAQWLQLDESIRRKLIQLFDIPQSGGRVVYGNKLTSDGHTFKDLASITIEKMQNYLGELIGDDADFFDLFSRVLAKLKDDSTTLIAKEANRVETENVARWLMVIRGIKQEATYLGLLDQFNELLKEFNPSLDVQLKKGPGRPKAKAGRA